MSLEIELKELLLKTPQLKKKWLVLKNAAYDNFLEQKYPGVPINQKTYLLEHDMLAPPTCPIDGNKLYFDAHGYARTCSKQCMHMLWKQNGQEEERLKKQIATNQTRYGVDHPLQNKDIMKKIENTNMKLYGVKTTLLEPVTGEKIKQTLWDNYRVDNPMYSEEIKQRQKDTLFGNYGVDNPMQSEEIKQRAQETNLRIYGVKNPNQNEDIKNKKRETNLARRGTEYPFQNEEVKTKIKETNLQIYGTEHPIDSKIVQDKIKQTRIETFYRKFNCIFLSRILPLDAYIDVYKSAAGAIEFICNKCNNRQIVNIITFTKRLNIASTPCKYCAGIGKHGSSLGQIQVTQYIKDLGFDILENNKLVISPKELDIIIPEKKIAIEYHGLYWHSAKFSNKKDHLDKLNLTNQADYRLIQIFEDEWIYKSDIVKNKLAHILGCNTKKIYARNCIVKELTMIEARDFINIHHIQGYHGSRYRYGLYHDNELVSVMTFALPNKAKGGKLDGTIELDRYCSKITIVGGASKLLNYFCKSHPEWKIIFSYADRRWSEGNLYTKIGFQLVHMTKPNYWYVRGGKRIHRFGLRKNQYDDPNLTEIENRISQGYNIIYDCGSWKFCYQNPYSK